MIDTPATPASYRIALLPGDGIGPECMQATRTVLERIATESGLTLKLTSHHAGATRYRETGVAMPDVAS